VTLAYQVEELAPYVHCLGDPKEAGGYLGHWVSDKYADEELLFVGTLEGRGELSREYLRYQEALGSRGEYWVEQPEKRLLEKCRGVGHVRFRPSVCSWNFEKNPSIEKFAENFDSCLPLDSKVTSPSVLLFHMAQDHSHWSFLGNLDLGSDAPFSAAEKELWRQQVQQQIREARLVRDHVLDRIVRSASPASPMFGPSSAGGAGGMSGGGGVPLFAELFATLALDEAIDGSLDVADGGVLRLSPLEGGSAAGGAGARISLDGALGGDRSVSGSPGFDFFSIPSSSAPE
jgi:hypothetical protein